MLRLVSVITIRLGILPMMVVVCGFGDAGDNEAEFEVDVEMLEFEPGTGTIPEGPVDDDPVV